MTEVIKDTFETRMKIRDFDAKIRKLEERVNEIEKKQAERYPNLIGRIGRMENSFPALVDRINDLERSILRLENNDSEMDYSGAFETDIKYG